MLRKLALLRPLSPRSSPAAGTSTNIVTVAETEGIYVDVGGLTYQVQLSRFLNPGDVEDKQYLYGLPDGVPTAAARRRDLVRRLDAGQELLRRGADADGRLQDRRHRGQRVRADVRSTVAANPFAYDPIQLLAAQVLPTPDTAAASGPIQGSLILFRLKTESLPNRPLQARDRAEGDESAEIDLDL